ncbi:transposase [Desulfallas sp. Bu1-1]|nr:transposase [Desulfallas sp. Bu1-1]
MSRLKNGLELIACEKNVYGYRKLRRCLQRQHGLVINKKKVYRLCKEIYESTRFGDNDSNNRRPAKLCILFFL